MRTDQWQQAVCKDPATLPLLQPGEHMTVGQVRSPELHGAFVEEFRKWYLDTKSKFEHNKGSKKAWTYMIELADFQVVTAARKIKVTPAAKNKIRAQVARMLGWEGKTVQELKEVLTQNSDDVLKLVLRASRQKQQQDRRRQQALDAQQQPVQGTQQQQPQQQPQPPQQPRPQQPMQGAQQQQQMQMQGAQQQQQPQQLNEPSEAEDQHEPDQEPDLLPSDDGELQAHSDSDSDVGNDAADMSASELPSEAEVEEDHSEEDEEEEKNKEGKGAWIALKCDLEVDVHVVDNVVPDDDERVPLRGGKGIWAGRDYQQAEVLGPYRHYCLFSNTYHKSVLPNPPHTWRGGKASWELHLESYACSDEACRLGGGDQTGSYSLINSGFGYGNATAYANDPCADPLGHMFKEGQPDDYLGPCIKGPDGQELQGNVMCGVVKILGWPYLFMFTVDKVPQGQEFLYYYGHSYWVFAGSALEKLDSWRRQQELERELKRYRSQQASQMTSGLTTSIQGGAGAGEAQGGRHRNLDTAAAAAAAGTESAAAPAASGLTSVGQAMAGMQLQHDNRTGRNLMQQQHQQQQQQQHDAADYIMMEEADWVRYHQQRQRQRQLLLQHGDDGDAAAAPAAAGGGDESQGSAVEAAGEADGEDAVTSAHARNLAGFRSQMLQMDEQQLQKLKDRYAKHQQQQEIAGQRTNERGEMRTVLKINHPDVVELLRRTQQNLAKELLKYEMGVKMKKLSDSWWDEEVQKYEYDKWEFIKRRDCYFQLSSKVHSPNTVVSLTDEYRQGLLQKTNRPKGRMLPRTSQRTARPPGKKRVREVVIKDPDQEAELQQKKMKLAESEGQVQQLKEQLQLLEEENQLLLQHIQAERLQLPQQLKRKLQQLKAQRSGGSSQKPAAAAAAGRAAVAVGPAAGSSHGPAVAAAAAGQRAVGGMGRQFVDSAAVSAPRVSGVRTEQSMGGSKGWGTATAAAAAAGAAVNGAVAAGPAAAAYSDLDFSRAPVPGMGDIGTSSEEDEDEESG